MIRIAIRHWLHLLGDNPFLVLFTNASLLVLAGSAFGVVPLLPLPPALAVALGVGLMLTAAYLTAGLAPMAHHLSKGLAWSLSTPWRLAFQNPGPSLITLLWWGLCLGIGLVSVPAYLGAPDRLPPDPPTNVVAWKEGGRFRLLWTDPLDADLSHISLLIQAEGGEFRGRVDAGMGTYLMPEFEGQARILLAATDTTGLSSEAVEVILDGEEVLVTPPPSGVGQGQPRIEVTAQGVRGFGLGWDQDREGRAMSRDMEYRVVAAPTAQELPRGEELSPNATVLMDWSQGVLRRNFGFWSPALTLWVTVQARTTEGVVQTAEPVRVSLPGWTSLVAAGLTTAVLVWLVLTLPFWTPWKILTGQGWLKSLAQSQVFLAGELGFLLWTNALAAAGLLLSALLLTVLPGALGVGLWYFESLRLRLKAREWLNAHPDHRPPPWGLIFEEERQQWENRRLRSYLTPWR